VRRVSPLVSRACAVRDAGSRSGGLSTRSPAPASVQHGDRQRELPEPARPRSARREVGCGERVA
jgi:hypothetical protein